MPPDPADDPILADCKYKLNHFRIKELKDVLHQLELPKQGRKQELVDGILALLSDQQDQGSKMNGLSNIKLIEKATVATIVGDTFIKMHGSTNVVPASRDQTDPGYIAKPKRKSDDYAQLDVKVRCPCGYSMANDSLIKVLFRTSYYSYKYYHLGVIIHNLSTPFQCEGSQCNTQQHVGCVIISEKPADSVPPELPLHFYCDICRISRADPFWVTINHPVLPVSITPSKIAPDGSYAVQYFEKTFPISRAFWEMLQKDEYDLQVWCILFNDNVPFRMHWPLHSDIQINGIPIRVVNRPSTQQLGVNGRDDGPILTSYVREGSNKIVLSRSDSRTFCLGVRIVKRRSVEQEQDGENFNDALARVRRCVGGGTEADNADSDSDIEVVADSVSVNLRCPMTGSRIKIAGRFKPCVHMGCFDLEAFVELNQRSRKWQCPICLKNYSLDNIIIDPYFNRITSLIQCCGDDVSEIDVKPDGSWRVKGGSELKGLVQWHLPDGTLCMPTNIGSKPNLGIVKHEIKEEPLSEDTGGRLKLGIRRNNNGQWEINNRGDSSWMPPSDNGQNGHFEGENCVGSTSNTDDENGKNEIYNQEIGQFDQFTSNVHDLDSSPLDAHFPPPPTEQDIILLSDSDDDNVMVLSPGGVNFSSAHDNGNAFPPNPPEASGICEEQPRGGPYEALPLEGLDDLELPCWEFSLSPQDAAGTHVTDNQCEVQDYPDNRQSLHEPISGVHLGVTAAVNPLECELDGLQASRSSERDGDHNQTCRDGHSEDWTNHSISSTRVSVVRSGDNGLRGEMPTIGQGQDRSVRQKIIVTIESDSD
uniref:SP-RING-type domain-containing protein n=1 Tax=Leersia perrieri TaxID=77586 RepID=A0A0D9XN58_9ORYZ